jgi:type I restriction-modification system DNA methylase subunit
MHIQFLKDQIYGIDAMLFASHMTATNLLLQMGNVIVDKINVFPANSLDELTKEDKNSQIVPDGYFDLTIMNPPFTFWRRLPTDERIKLEKSFGTSSMNYWGYFLLAAMPKLRENGMIATVLPDDFLRGKGAANVRDPLFKDDSYSLLVSTLNIKASSTGLTS